MGVPLAALALGLLVLPVLPLLPPAAALFALALVLAAAAWRWRRGRPALMAAACFLLASGWSVREASRALAARIPPAWEGVVLQVAGVTEGLPEAAEPRGARFRFRPAMVAAPPGLAPLAALSRQRWQLFSPQPALPPPGSHCRLELRLKRPHGAANPGGFDYEAWLLSEGVTATGSVRRLACRPGAGVSMDGLRFRLRQDFQQRFSDRPAAGVLLALVTGDRSLVPPASWDTYAATGVVHLMAISGLHVMLLAGVFAWLLLRLLRCWPALALRLPLQRPVMVAGLLVALGYSLLAGFSVPTERTLVMAAMVVLASLSGRRLAPFLVLALALVTVLAMAPLAVHGAGLWLSFGAVAVLMLVGEGDAALPAWRQVLHLQFAVTLLLLPLTLWFFESLSWVSPFANLVAVPLVTFGVVPLGLLGFLCWLAGWDMGAGLAWSGGVALVEVLDALMAQFAAWPFATLALALQGSAGLLWLVLAIGCLLQPASLRLRLLAPVFLLPLAWPPATVAPGQLRLTVIDVGQGLAVLVETAGHRLLYDTGPALGPRADAGERHVLPVLRRRGIRALDLLVLSHGDLDHTGGAAAVLAGLPVARGLGAAPPVATATPWQDCRAGQRWRWDGWEFTVLYPDAREHRAAKNDNERSCVLRVRGAGRSLLLPGDIGKPAERALLRRLGPPDLAADVLVLGHHGSRGSSTPAFLEAVRPSWALVSAGYRNAFRHPSPQVIARLEARGVRWRNTATAGALALEVGAGGELRLEAWRQVSGRYWQTDDAAGIFADKAGIPALGGFGLTR